MANPSPTKLSLVPEPSNLERGKIDVSVDGADHLELMRDRIKYLRNQKKFTQSDVATGVGVSRAAVGQWETTNITPSHAKIEELAAFLGSTPEWITYRRGAPHVKLAYGSQSNSDVVWVNHISYGPTVGSVKKGAPWGIPRAFVDETLGATGSLIAYTVRNDSVAPIYTQGDLVFVDADDKSPSPSGIFLYWDGMGSALATLSPLPGKEEAMVRITTNHGEALEVALADLTIMGRVLGRFQRS